MSVLNIENLTMRFGGVTAVDAVGLTADADAITSIIGPNGAGKTTLFNCITGFYVPTEGKMTLTLPGKSPLRLEKMKGHRIAKAGVSRTFQNIRLFPRMTALENLLVAQHNALMKASLFSIAGLLHLPRYQKAEAEAVERAKYWLEKTRLYKKADTPAGDLPYGEQRHLEIARAMCMQPAVLCLDEPAAGLNPKESVDLTTLLQEIKEDHIWLFCLLNMTWGSSWVFPIRLSCWSTAARLLMARRNKSRMTLRLFARIWVMKTRNMWRE